MGRNGVTGIIVPVPSQITNRIFHHHEVYAMVATDDRRTEVAEGDRIFFYDTGGKGLEGEAVIEKLTFEPASKVKLYGNDLYLSLEELERYLADAHADDDDAEMLVLKVEGATKYSRPLKCTLEMEGGSVYMTKQVFSQIVGENQ
jgi:hypothetical protein